MEEEKKLEWGTKKIAWVEFEVVDGESTKLKLSSQFLWDSCENLSYPGYLKQKFKILKFIFA